MDTVKEVVENGLCTGCGTCAGVCPADAIEMTISHGLFLPKINLEKCTFCGLCHKCCPGFAFDLEDSDSGVFGKHPKDPFLGSYRACYLGHSTDREVRSDSSSGGLVTQLALFALERGIVDGVLVVRMRKDRPLEPEPFVARTKEEVISASKSKYCPVPMNDALKCVLEEKGKFAVVGLPCQIHGVRKAENSIKGLREKIVLRLGIMCSHTVNFLGTEYLLKKLDISREQVAEITYRGQGWPGSMLVRLKNRSSISVPYVGRWNAYGPVFSCFFFTPQRCLMCPDEANEFADISFGDAWLPELRNERNGESVVVTRTAKGEEILNLAGSAGVVSLKSVECQKVRQSQAVPFKFKKYDVEARLAVLEASGQKIPEFGLSNLSSHSRSLSSFLRNFFVFLNVRASEKRGFERILVHVPLSLIRLYYGVYKFLSYI